jgi:hypothetical protein
MRYSFTNSWCLGQYKNPLSKRKNTQAQARVAARKVVDKALTQAEPSWEEEHMPPPDKTAGKRKVAFKEPVQTASKRKQAACKPSKRAVPVEEEEENNDSDAASDGVAADMETEEDGAAVGSEDEAPTASEAGSDGEDQAGLESGSDEDDKSGSDGGSDGGSDEEGQPEPSSVLAVRAPATQLAVPAATAQLPVLMSSKEIRHAAEGALIKVGKLARIPDTDSIAMPGSTLKVGVLNAAQRNPIASRPEEKYLYSSAIAYHYNLSPHDSVAGVIADSALFCSAWHGFSARCAGINSAAEDAEERVPMEYIPLPLVALGKMASVALGFDAVEHETATLSNAVFGVQGLARVAGKKTAVYNVIPLIAVRFVPIILMVQQGATGYQNQMQVCVVPFKEAQAYTRFDDESQSIVFLTEKFMSEYLSLATDLEASEDGHSKALNKDNAGVVQNYVQLTFLPPSNWLTLDLRAPNVAQSKAIIERIILVSTQLTAKFRMGKRLGPKVMYLINTSIPGDYVKSPECTRFCLDRIREGQLMYISTLINQIKTSHLIVQQGGDVDLEPNMAPFYRDKMCYTQDDVFQTTLRCLEAFMKKALAEDKALQPALPKPARVAMEFDAPSMRAIEPALLEAAAAAEEQAPEAAAAAEEQALEEAATAQVPMDQSADAPATALSG